MSYKDELEAAAARATEASNRAEAAAQIIHDVANGLDNQTVVTANGEVVTVANALKQLKEADFGKYDPAEPLTGVELLWLKQGDKNVHLPVQDLPMSVNGQVGEVVLDTDDVEEGATNKYYPSADATKLAGIQSGAEVNDVDSVNGQTGDVSLNATDVGAIPSAEKGVASGVASLDATGKVPEAQLPALGIEEAPIDGGTYGRKDGAWTVVTGGGGGDGSAVTLDGPVLIDTAGEDVPYTITNYSSFSTYSVSITVGTVSRNGDTITINMGGNDLSGEVILTVTKDGVGSDFPIQWENPSIEPLAGEPYGGGYYAGANIVVEGVEYRVIVAPKAQGGEAHLPWEWTVDPDVQGAMSTNDGKTNTAAIVAAGGGSSSVAAGFCDNLDINGYSDWHLPSPDELEICYRYLKPTTQSNYVNSNNGPNPGGNGSNPNSDPVGGGYTSSNPSQTSIAIYQSGGDEAFIATHYLTSMQDSSGRAWRQLFGDGNQLTGLKSNPYYVRAVRWVQV